MRRVGLLTPLVACVLLGLVARTAKAQATQFVHTVRAGETLASIAQTYYGDAARENVLMAENGLSEHGGPSLVSGLRLSIPSVSYYQAREGDSWRDLADRYYGDPDRAPILIKANDADAASEPDVDAQLLIPYPLRHVVKPGELLAHIGRRYYSNTEHLRWLRIFNRKLTKLMKGDLVLVPMFDLKLSESGRHKLEQESGLEIASGELKRKQQALEPELTELGRLSAAGHFVEAVVLANRLLGSKLTTGYQRLRIKRELATAYVALDREDLAVEAFRDVVKKQPDFELDSAKTSPRILAALREAKALAKGSSSAAEGR